jgi:endonuclease G
MAILIIGVILFLMYGLKQIAEFSQAPVLADSGYHPDPKAGTVYIKPGFSLSYVEEFELPEWVSYSLTVTMLNKPKYDRNQDFEPDPAIRSGSAHYRDYKGSGFRRGHLVPSADMAWNKEAMDATFLMSNIAPMREVFNNGVWNELEQNVRDWARKYESIQVVTGPLLKSENESIGDNEVLVPKYFYKAVFTAQQQQPQVVAFLIDQDQDAFENLNEYVVSIDSLEKITGIDFFANLYGNWDTEIKLEREKSFDENVWPLNERWLKQRIDAEERARSSNNTPE